MLTVKYSDPHCFRSQHLEVGTPVELKIPNIVMHSRDRIKLIAFGGESGDAHIYEYDTDDSGRQAAASGVDTENANTENSVKSRKVVPATHKSVDGSSDRPELGRESSRAQRKILTDAELSLAPDKVTSVLDPHLTARKVMTRRIGPAVNGVSLSGDAERVAICDAGGNAVVIAVGALGISSEDGSQKSAASNDGGSTIFAHKNYGQDGLVHAVWEVGLSFSGERLVMCGSGKNIRAFGVDSGAELYRRHNIDRMECVAISSDGENLASGAEDGRISACSITGGARLFSFEQFTNVRRPHAFLPVQCECVRRTRQSSIGEKKMWLARPGTRSRGGRLRQRRCRGV